MTKRQTIAWVRENLQVGLLSATWYVLINGLKVQESEK